MGDTLALETGEDLRKVALNDYRLACISREASLLGRKEVLTGKAKFGIFGDGRRWHSSPLHVNLEMAISEAVTTGIKPS